MKIRTGDTVVVIAGKDKGKTGQVLRVLPTKKRVVVSDINMRTKHVKKTPQRAGEIVKYEAGIDQSNVMLVDPKTKKRTRVGFIKDEKGKKRIAKKSGEVVLKAAVATKKKEAKEAPESSSKAPKKADKKETAGGKQPFWKKVGFGADEVADLEGQDKAASSEDHSVPDQSNRSPSRSSGRGS